jgi:hypothetical protein
VKAITSGFDGVRVTGSRFNVSQSANITCNNAGMIHSKPNINSSSGVDYLFLDTPKSSDNCWIQITDQNTGASNVVYFQISGPISSSVPSITIDAKALMGINDSVVTIYGQNLYNKTAHIINPNDGNIEVAKAQLGSDANWLNSDKTSVSFKVYLVQSNYAVYLTDSSGNVSNKVEILLHAYSQNTGNSFSMGWQAGGTNASYGDTYANPRIFSLTSTEEYVPATDQASVDKWCQSIVGKSYFSGTASSYTAGSGKRTQWNGNTWIINAYSTTDYPGSITCSNSQSSSQQQNQITLSASVINNTDNKAGRVGVFGPGNLSTPVDGKVLKDITIKTNDGSNIWSTSNSANYPLVLFINGKQLNSSYSFTQALVNGSRVITAYGQQEETAWNGGNIFITFTDGSSVFAPIQAYNVTPPVATPTITSISPTSGPAGSTITIYGNNFNSMDTIVLYLSSNHNNTIMPPPNSVSKDGTSMNFVIPQNSLVSKYDLAIFTPATIGQISNSISSNEVPFTITSATPTQASRMSCGTYSYSIGRTKEPAGSSLASEPMPMCRGSSM